MEKKIFTREILRALNAQGCLEDLIKATKKEYFIQSLSC